jgi:subfamily B ATP-binding cassette protein HlyB/CyaB
MLRYARELAGEARSRTTRWKRLRGIRLPRIASPRDGEFLLPGKIDGEAALVLHPAASSLKQ